MENVISLADRKARRMPIATKTPPPDRPRFYCTCDMDLFKLYADKSVHCASCGALIWNLSSLNAKV